MFLPSHSILSSEKWGSSVPILARIIDSEGSDKVLGDCVVFGTLFKEMHLRSSVRKKRTEHSLYKETCKEYSLMKNKWNSSVFITFGAWSYSYFYVCFSILTSLKLDILMMINKFLHCYSTLWWSTVFTMYTVTILPCYGQVLDEFKEHNGISGGVQTLYNFASKVSTYVLPAFAFAFV